MPIRMLPPRTAALIAAGEVVDRPSSVVRELVDNALDAGASKIEVSLTGNGLAQIAVTDDGAGMPPEDLELCLEHHSTSKLPQDDIRDIATLGFRGEALASMTAVATVSVTSRPAGQDVAFSITRGSRTANEARPSAGGFGTRVVVRDIFADHPARLKFMKQDRTEKAWVTEVIQRAAVAHPDVEFIYSTATERRRYAPASFSYRMLDVMGKSASNDFVTVSKELDGVVVKGITVLPSALKPAPGRQLFVVNGRPVADRVIAGAASSVYRSLVGHKEPPSLALHISLPVSEVDVNVHPQKAEVRFLHPEKVSSAVREALTDALGAAGMKTPDAMFEMARRLAVPGEGNLSNDRRRLPLGRFLGQVDDMWIVAETVEGMVIVDQHAAHERVVLERLKAAMVTPSTVIGVSPPVVRELDPESLVGVLESMDTLTDLGFVIRELHGTVSLQGYPEILAGCDPSELFDALIDGCRRGASGGSIGEATWETLATAACKAAVKAGMALDPDRADRLLREIEATPNAAQCNHGRPTMVFLKSSDIAKLFAR